MNKILANKKIGQYVVIACIMSIVLVCILLFIQKSFVKENEDVMKVEDVMEVEDVRAAEDITGEWEIKIDFHGLMRLATLSFSRKADGSLMGKCGSSTLNNVTFKGGKLTFVRIHQTRARDFRDEYTLTLKEGRLTGTMSGDLGNFTVNGLRKRPKNSVLGQWDIITTAGKVEITGRLIISENPDGSLAGKWDYGREEITAVITNIKFKDGKLSFTRKAKLSYIHYGKLIEDEFEESFKGTINGHKLTGVTRDSEGESPSTGKRVGAALVGTWELSETIYGKTTTSIMKINGDLTGKYEEPSGDEIIIKNLKLESDQVTFFLEVGMEDLVMRRDFKGKLDGKILRGEFDGKTIKGEHSFEKYTKKVTGKKID
jgi:hypothetical protein